MTNDALLIWTSACRSDVGKVREINEDSCLDLPELGLWVVADGMGGHEAGDIASRTVVDALRQLPEPTSLRTFVEDARRVLIDTNYHLRQMAASRENDTVIGCTVVALFAFGNECACMWAGDSRVYRLRSGQLQRMTHDHTLADEYVERGLIRPEEADSHPDANILTRAVGGDDELEVDVIFDATADGDTFMLCSDGLYREVDEGTIAHTMALDDCTQIADSLIESALSNGAHDNTTVTVVKFRDALQLV